MNAGWTERYHEYIPRDSFRLAPLGTRARSGKRLEVMVNRMNESFGDFSRAEMAWRRWPEVIR